MNRDDCGATMTRVSDRGCPANDCCAAPGLPGPSDDHLLRPSMARTRSLLEPDCAGLAHD